MQSELLPALSAPETIPNHERVLAKAVHFALYVLMILVPLSGFIMSNAGGHNILFFGIMLPDLIATDKAIGSFFHKAHYYAGYILLTIVIIHIAGALKHRLMDSRITMS